LSAAGYDQNTPRAVAFVPQMGGDGILHLYTEMLGMKLDMVISHIRANSQLRPTKENEHQVSTINYRIGGTSPEIYNGNIICRRKLVTSFASVFGDN
jgi:hypothetical protein